MKNNTLLLVVLSIMIFLSACKKDDNNELVPIYDPGPQEHGYGIGEKSQLTWEASAFARFHSGDTSLIGITFTTYEDGFLREHLAFNEIPMKTGIYTIKGSTIDFEDGFVGTIYDTSEYGGDVNEDFYLLDENVSGNEIQITSFDASQMMLKGTIKVSYKIEDKSEKVNDLNPDKVTFSNIRFECKIIM